MRLVKSELTYEPKDNSYRGIYKFYEYECTDYVRRNIDILRDRVWFKIRGKIKGKLHGFS